MKPTTTQDGYPLPVTAEERQSVETGKQWIRDWYQARAQETGPNGKPYVTETQLEQMMDRLDHVRVYCGANISEAIIKDLREGKLHFKPELLKEATFEELIQNMENSSQEFDYLGIQMPRIQEPIIGLNRTLIEASQNRNIPSSITAVTIHELTHLLEVNARDYNRIEQIQADRPQAKTELLDVLKVNDPEKWMLQEAYYDNPLEIHARLNVMRYQFGISPSQPVTNEEIERIRQEIAAPHAPGKDNPVDNELFNNYPNQELKAYFNEVAEHTRDMDELEDTHLEARPDNANTTAQQLATTTQKTQNVAIQNHPTMRHHIG